PIPSLKVERKAEPSSSPSLNRQIFRLPVDYLPECEPIHLAPQVAKIQVPWLRDARYGVYERQNRENCCDCLIMSGSGLTRSVNRPHQQRQIACRRLDQQFLVHISHASDV